MESKPNVHKNEACVSPAHRSAAQAREKEENWKVNFLHFGRAIDVHPEIHLGLKLLHVLAHQ